MKFEYLIRTRKPYARDIPLVNVFYKEDHASVVAYLPFEFKDKPRIRVIDGVLTINMDTTKGKVGRDIPIPKDFKTEKIIFTHETLKIELGKRS